ncbi:MAG: hypothetical protein HOV79_31190 [Hamadaea sp.]|nr:hypothetical protein [Hamadaea sp.]
MTPAVFTASQLRYSLRSGGSLLAAAPLDVILDRLNRRGWSATGIEMSKRRYSHRFRVAQQVWRRKPAAWKVRQAGRA